VKHQPTGGSGKNGELKGLQLRKWREQKAGHQGEKIRGRVDVKPLDLHGTK